MSNRVVWVDIPVRDLDRAIAFYSGVLGVAISKEKLEEENLVSHEKSIRPIDPDLELRLQNAGSNFLLGDIFRDEFADKSYISSISQKSLTPISEMSRVIPTPMAHTPVPSDSVA